MVALKAAAATPVLVVYTLDDTKLSVEQKEGGAASESGEDAEHVLSED